MSHSYGDGRGRSRGQRASAPCHPGAPAIREGPHTRLPIRGAGSGSVFSSPYILQGSGLEGDWLSSDGWSASGPLQVHSCDDVLRQQCWWSGGHTYGYGRRSLQPNRSERKQDATPAHTQTLSARQVPTPCKTTPLHRHQRSHPQDRASWGKMEHISPIGPTAVG
jgi:hypothetical protein